MNVIRSVTRNGRSIILTAILGIILVYLFSIIGYLFFQDDFVVEIDPLNKTGKTREKPAFIWEMSVINGFVYDAIISAYALLTSVDDLEDMKEQVCDTLLMCIVTTLNQGLRNGGGIGDVLRPPSKTVGNIMTG